MKKLFLLFIITISVRVVTAQTSTVKIAHRIRLTENTVVKDTNGTQLSYMTWKNLLSTGSYKLKPLDPGNDSTAFVLLKMDGTEKNNMMNRLPKPAESMFFIT